MSPRTTDRVTLATVADAVGVSRMTVSNAYNRPDQLSPELRERVLAAAQELGYSGPNPVARTLSRGETGSVGLVLDYPLTQAFTDPATVEFLHGVAAGCEERARGLSLVPRIEGGDAGSSRARWSTASSSTACRRTIRAWTRCAAAGSRTFASTSIPIPSTSTSTSTTRPPPAPPLST